MVGLALSPRHLTVLIHIVLYFDSGTNALRLLIDASVLPKLFCFFLLPFFSTLLAVFSFSFLPLFGVTTGLRTPIRKQPPSHGFRSSPSVKLCSIHWN
ncbi:hypothetical protein Gogos_008454, partial [Gossypium gossypioides]|nr:hypothetical protein [Gossypium gossypioides]